MHSATAAGAGTSLPVLAAGAAPPAGLPAADQAFDDVFHQLVGGLLTTSADGGEAAAEPDGDVIEAAGAATPTHDVTAMVPVAVPMAIAVAVTGTALLDDTDGGGEVIDAATSDHTNAAGSGGTTSAATAAAGSVATTTAARRGAAHAGYADTPSDTGHTGHTGRMAEAGATGQVDLAGTAATTINTAAVTAAASAITKAPAPAHATGANGAPVGHVPMASIGEAVTDGLEINETPVHAAGTETPATEVEAHVRGLDRRRGMRETPARARRFDDGAPAVPAEARGTVGTPIEATPTPASTAAPSAPPATAPREMPVPAERALALQRALARQVDGDTRETPAPGLAAQAALSGGATATGAGTGTEHGSDPNDRGRKQGRAWSNAMPAGAPAAGAPAAGVPAAATPGATDQAGPTAGAAWRAALTSTGVAEALVPLADAARTPGLPGAVATMLQAFELPVLRDRAPMVVDLPTEIPDLDGPTAEAVHTQIVRSIRMQWTGAASSEARVTLRPEYLGEVVATIKVDQGVVTATLQADTPEVRRWMESHTATLRDALVEHGLKLDRLTVSEPEKQSAQGDRQAKSRQQPQDPPRQRARRETSDQDAPFEVTTE